MGSAVLAADAFRKVRMWESRPEVVAVYGGPQPDGTFRIVFDVSVSPHVAAVVSRDFPSGLKEFAQALGRFADELREMV